MVTMPYENDTQFPDDTIREVGNAILNEVKRWPTDSNRPPFGDRKLPPLGADNWHVGLAACRALSDRKIPSGPAVDKLAALLATAINQHDPGPTHGDADPATLMPMAEMVLAAGWREPLHDWERELNEPGPNAQLTYTREQMLDMYQAVVELLTETPRPAIAVGDTITVIAPGGVTLPGTIKALGNTHGSAVVVVLDASPMPRDHSAGAQLTCNICGARVYADKLDLHDHQKHGKNMWTQPSAQQGTGGTGSPTAGSQREN